MTQLDLRTAASERESAVAARGPIPEAAFHCTTVADTSSGASRFSNTVPGTTTNPSPSTAVGIALPGLFTASNMKLSVSTEMLPPSVSSAAIADDTF